MNKKNALIASVTAVALIALFVLINQQGKVTRSAKPMGEGETVPQTSQPSAAQQEGRRASPEPVDDVETENGSAGDGQTFKEVVAIASSEDFDKAFASIDLFNRAETTHLVQRFRKSDEKIIAAAFKSKLQGADQDEGTTRSRAVLLAEAWGSESLVPFWKDLALRETVHFENEKNAIFSKERTLMSGIILQEIQAAISHLGILANRNEESLKILEKIVLEPDPNVHSSFIRQRAFHALKEANAQAALVALKSLDPDDPLRNDLRR